MNSKFLEQKTEKYEIQMLICGGGRCSESEHGLQYDYMVRLEQVWDRASILRTSVCRQSVWDNWSRWDRLRCESWVACVCVCVFVCLCVSVCY